MVLFGILWYPTAADIVDTMRNPRLPLDSSSQGGVVTLCRTCMARVIVVVIVPKANLHFVGMNDAKYAHAMYMATKCRQLGGQSISANYPAI